MHGSSPTVSPDGTQCAYVTDATSITIGRRIRYTIALLCSKVCPDAVLSLRWSPDGAHILARLARCLVVCLSLHHDRSTNLWSLRITARVDEAFHTLYHAAWWGRLFYTQGSIATSIWSLAASCKIMTLAPDAAIVIAITPSCSHLVIAGIRDVTLFTGDCNLVATWSHSGHRPTKMATDHGGFLIALLCAPKNLLECWTCAGGKVREIADVVDVTWSGSYICCTMGDGTALVLAGSQTLHVTRIVDPSMTPTGNTLQEHDGRYAVASSSSVATLQDTSPQLVAAGRDNIAVTVLYASSVVHVEGTVLRHNASVLGMAWSPDGHRLVIRCEGSRDTLYMWEPRKASCARIPFAAFSLSCVGWVDPATMLLEDHVGHNFCFAWLSEA